MRNRPESHAQSATLVAPRGAELCAGQATRASPWQKLSAGHTTHAGAPAETSPAAPGIQPASHTQSAGAPAPTRPRVLAFAGQASGVARAASPPPGQKWSTAHSEQLRAAPAKPGRHRHSSSSALPAGAVVFGGHATTVSCVGQ